MKSKSHEKPDFISFYRSEWHRETDYIYSKNGKVFEQIHRNRFRLIYCVLFIVVLIASFLLIILLPLDAPKTITSLPYLLFILLIALYPIVTYKISRYRLVEDEELIKKPNENEEDQE